ncbi:uncharacterized protein LOC132036733 [Lycium ferocissimum]|uniref:uncharacterized protein LOC132036733 n=1 Tax=Lycium ferocissimum TaxID=112874 RepID=UPI0028158385|nr:uncharacterized protein LOC132036733 [Lycium ferocissimum]
MGTAATPILARVGDNNFDKRTTTSVLEEIPPINNYAKAIQSTGNPSPKENRFGNPKIKARVTSHNGVPAALFKTSEFYGEMANECKFTLVGKFIKARPQIEKIRSKFAEKITVRGGNQRSSL